MNQILNFQYSIMYFYYFRRLTFFFFPEKEKISFPTIILNSFKLLTFLSLDNTWMSLCNFSKNRGTDGYFASVSTGKAIHWYTFRIKVLRNQPAINPGRIGIILNKPKMTYS